MSDDVRVVEEFGDDDARLNRVHLHAIVLVLQKFLEQGQEVVGDCLGIERVADDGHGLGRAPTHHRCIISDQLGELRADHLPLLFTQAPVDLGVELARSDPHRVVVSFIQSADQLDILAIDGVLIEHVSDLLE